MTHPRKAKCLSLGTIFVKVENVPSFQNKLVLIQDDLRNEKNDIKIARSSSHFLPSVYTICNALHIAQNHQFFN